MVTPAAPTHVVVWRSTTVDSGELCVMTSGLQQTLVLLVINLDFLLPVPGGPQVVLEGEGLYSAEDMVAMGTIMLIHCSSM